jgi:Asp-tRNA(Asn)/Glu-tRNA(Gln) amidotransferase A subunit family amidase
MSSAAALAIGAAWLAHGSDLGGSLRRNYLPVGLQVVACPRAEASLLAGARLFEEIFELRGITAIEPRVMHL